MMIWFGNLPQPAFRRADPELFRGNERARMAQALRMVAAREPHLTGDALLEALTATGGVDWETAERLLPWFRDFDRDRHFTEDLRRISLKGTTVADEFRVRVRRVVEDIAGSGHLGEVGPEEGIRFRTGEHEGIVLAYPQTGFTLGGATRQAVAAAVEEMPDALVIVARHFQEGTADHLAGVLSGSEVPGTLVTVNLLLGIRAVALRYQPSPDRIVDTLGAGRPLRSVDVALLGNRN
ncbi:MAG TPA: hypothetical protein VHG28_17950 [Longimicrobiaceae bacterium]|nr:hypothetical protein [Longimicrobiaceae bacterium]